MLLNFSSAELKGNLPKLDGLRAISVLFVVLSHSGFGNIIPGGFGVTIFFFISGYLITTLLRKELELNYKINLKNFYLRRFWRLVPALIIYVLIAVIANKLVKNTIATEESLAAIFYLSNYYDLYKGYTPLSKIHSPYDILWSLSIEEHFYIFFAPLLLLFKLRSKITLLIISLTIIPLLLRINAIFFDFSSFNKLYTYIATECRMDSIAFGCLLAYFNINTKNKNQELFSLLLGSTIIIFTLLYRNDDFRETFRYTLQGIGLFLIINNIIHGKHTQKITNFLEIRPLIFIGKISYSIYLYHWLALIIIELVTQNNSLTVYSHIAFWTLTATLSLASFFFVEQPCLGLRRRYGSHV